MNLLLFIFCSFGLTQILVYGSIFKPLRNKFPIFFDCSMCVGFWVGILVWVLGNLSNLILFNDSRLTGLLLGFLSSGTSYILCNLFGDEGFRFKKN